MTVDLTKPVMGKIANLERRQIGRFRAVFWTVTIILALALTFLVWRIAHVILSRGTLDLLALFGEDREIIAEFWQDNLAIFWEELPHRRLLWAGAVLGLVAFIFWVTKKTRQIIRRKLNQLKKIPQPLDSARGK